MAIDLTAYKLLSFDIYATLIDWETGILKALQPLVAALPSTSPYHSINSAEQQTSKALLQAFDTHERALLEEHPKIPYNDLLAQTYIALAVNTLNLPAPSAADATTFGNSVGTYPPFGDTISAMQKLGSRYRLVALSNVDNANFSRTLTGPLRGEVRFDAVYTAEDIGSYKPAPANFEYLIGHVGTQFGVAKGEILHVAQGLVSDHVATKAIGLAPGVWIRRGKDDAVDAKREGSVMGGRWEQLDREGKVSLGAVYGTLGEMAEAVEMAFEGR